MTTEFKAGDRVRRVKSPRDHAPIGYETTVIHRNFGLMWRDQQGMMAFINHENWELATPAFDATKLRKGDKVLAIVTVNSDGLDAEGDVDAQEYYFNPDQIIGYAPGYTPAAEEPLKVGDKVEYDDSPGHLLITRINTDTREALLDLAYCPNSTTHWYVRPLVDLRRVIH